MGGGLGPLWLKVSDVFFGVPPLVFIEGCGEKLWEDGFVQSSQKSQAVTMVVSPRTGSPRTEQLLCEHLWHTGQQSHTFTDSAFIRAVSRVN